MSLAYEPAGERQSVHRMFTIRWMPGFMHTRIHGDGDEADIRSQIAAWSAMLREVIPELGPRYVSLIDATDFGGVPKTLWFALVELARNMSQSPVRRVLVTAEGRIGDAQAETAQLVTAGNVRVFRPDQLETALAWLAEAKVLDAATLSAFLR